MFFKHFPNWIVNLTFTIAPMMIQVVLKEYEDVMPAEVSKWWPPQREIDHQIELKSGTKPHVRSLYRMAPPKLVELQRQLK